MNTWSISHCPFCPVSCFFALILLCAERGLPLELSLSFVCYTHLSSPSLLIFSDLFALAMCLLVCRLTPFCSSLKVSSDELNPFKCSAKAFRLVQFFVLFLFWLSSFCLCSPVLLWIRTVRVSAVLIQLVTFSTAFKSYIHRCTHTRWT